MTTVVLESLEDGSDSESSLDLLVYENLWTEYELRKQEILENKFLTPRDYEIEIKKIVDSLGI